jgi:hypothetical protein
MTEVQRLLIEEQPLTGDTGGSNVFRAPDGMHHEIIFVLPEREVGPRLSGCKRVHAVCESISGRTRQIFLTAPGYEQRIARTLGCEVLPPLRKVTEVA